MWKTYPQKWWTNACLNGRFVENVENLSTIFVDKHIRIINDVEIVDILSTWIVDNPFSNSNCVESVEKLSTVFVEKYV